MFAGAVIDAAAFKRISSYIEHAKKSGNLEIIGGGKCDDSYVSFFKYFNDYPGFVRFNVFDVFIFSAAATLLIQQ